VRNYNKGRSIPRFCPPEKQGISNKEGREGSFNGRVDSLSLGNGDEVNAQSQFMGKDTPRDKRVSKERDAFRHSSLKDMENKRICHKICRNSTELENGMKAETYTMK
jgi:hypothetical protein